MAVDFRCEKCGGLLAADAERGSTVQCANCGSEVTVPPPPGSPQGPEAAPDMPRQGPAEPAPAHDEQVPPGDHDDVVMNVMASLMPWVMSLFFHLGLAI